MIITYPNEKYVPEHIRVIDGSKANTLKSNSSKSEEIILTKGRNKIQSIGMKGQVVTTEIKKGMLLTLSDFTLEEDLEMEEEYSDLELFQISFCLDGEFLWSFKNKETIQDYRLGAQECQIRFGTLEECRSIFYRDRKYHGISITLDKTIFEALFDCIYVRKAICVLEKDQPIRTYQYTSRISKLLSEIEECDLCEDIRNIYLHGKVLELLAVLCDEVICESTVNYYGIRIHKEEYEAILKAKDLIQREYANPLTVAEIAKKTAISESRLQEGFKQCFGKTVNTYIMERRMEMAKKLLETGNYSVDSTAWMVGYAHTGYFIRRFKEEYGMTPGEIKKTNK